MLQVSFHLFFPRDFSSWSGLVAFPSLCFTSNREDGFLGFPCRHDCPLCGLTYWYQQLFVSCFLVTFLNDICYNFQTLMLNSLCYRANVYLSLWHSSNVCSQGATVLTSGAQVLRTLSLQSPKTTAQSMLCSGIVKTNLAALCACMFMCVFVFTEFSHFLLIGCWL